MIELLLVKTRERASGLRKRLEEVVGGKCPPY